MTAKPDTYIFPPRSKSVIPRNETQFFAELGWVAQYKVNDSHLLLKLKPDTVEFWTRHGDRMSYVCPEWLLEQIRTAQDLLGLARDQYHLLDGGILDSRHSAIKDTIVIWDILVRNGEHLIGSTYQHRYLSLYNQAVEYSWGQYVMPDGEGHAVGVCVQENIFIPHTWPIIGSIIDSDAIQKMWDQMWDHVEMVNKPYPQPLLEGIVLKSPEGVLEHGFRESNNSSWIVRSRVETRRHRF